MIINVDENIHFQALNKRVRDTGDTMNGGIIVIHGNAGDDDREGDNFRHQVWYGGRHPIAWANNNYKMVYANWGHNLRSYNFGAEGTESKTFSCKEIETFVLDAMFGLTH